uniref:Uncharacterized protein n=1 Tax=Cucumis sativus TaxID=3659 RepID=A0A0A0L9F6_CUCSA
MIKYHNFGLFLIFMLKFEHLSIVNPSIELQNCSPSGSFVNLLQHERINDSRCCILFSSKAFGMFNNLGHPHIFKHLRLGKIVTFDDSSFVITSFHCSKLII